jgi:hypothetical protein
MQTRLIRVVATSLSEGVSWKGPAPCKDAREWHSARWKVAELPGDTNDGFPEVALESIPGRHPDAVCEDCGAPPSANVSGFSSTRRIYDTPSGRPEPGNLFWTPWMHDDRKCWRWENCNDPRGHLYCVLPDGHPWDIDGRASNCTMPEEKTHRCWVRHGDPDKGEAGPRRQGRSHLRGRRRQHRDARLPRLSPQRSADELLTKVGKSDRARRRE